LDAIKIKGSLGMNVVDTQTWGCEHAP